jgi:hypothetical protein
MSTTNHTAKATANPNTQEGVKAVKGIDKRTNQDGSESYRARVRIKGQPTVTKTFSSMTVAKKWKRDTEVAIEKGRYFNQIEAQKHTLGEAIDRYIKIVLPGKPKNAKNLLQHLLWWKQQLGEYSLDCLKPSLIAEKRDLLLTEPTHRGKLRATTTVVRYLSSLSHLLPSRYKSGAGSTKTPYKKLPSRASLIAAHDFSLMRRG